ncbi:MAG: DnaJ family molecular chaperone [Planctomycetales bacterium]
MSDPYSLLNVPSDADDATIRARYLELVREFPPDRAPEKFAAIRAAYEDLRHPSKRLQRQLFNMECSDSIEAIATAVRGRLTDVKLPLEALLSLAETP